MHVVTQIVKPVSVGRIETYWLRPARHRPKTLQELQRLTGTEFERLIASLFIEDGYVVSARGGSGDEGIDLILQIGTSRDVVQCKRWKSDIGSPVIREFYGSMMHAGGATRIRHNHGIVHFQCEGIRHWETDHAHRRRISSCLD